MGAKHMLCLIVLKACVPKLCVLLYSAVLRGSLFAVCVCVCVCVCHCGIRTFPLDVPPSDISPRTFPPPFLHGVGHSPLPPPPCPNLYKAIYR